MVNQREKNNRTIQSFNENNDNELNIIKNNSEMSKKIDSSN